MIVLNGAGSAAGNPPITAGPPGREVWNDELNGKHASGAKSEYLMPKGFNQQGNLDRVIENTVKLMRTKFDSI